MEHELSPKTLLAFLQTAGPVGKNDIAAAFGIKGDVRIALKDILRELTDSGQVIKVGGQRYALPEGLPDVCPLRITDITMDGEFHTNPAEWDTDRQGPRPVVALDTGTKEPATLSVGDVVLARIKKDDTGLYIGTFIRQLEGSSTILIGEVFKTSRGFAVRTLAKRGAEHYDVAEADLNEAHLHDIVKAEVIKGNGVGNDRARVLETIGLASDPKAMSLIAAYESGLRIQFPPSVIRETEKLPRPSLYDGLTDLRKIPLVTIDGEDARDFDDAVFAEKDDDPENAGGYHLIVAIADVSYYVRGGTNLDDEAYKRGNSTYFPDRVLPMLPEGLSNDLCSLKPHEDRYCLAVHMWIDKNGLMIRHKFIRGLMRSAARLTYTRVQAAYDGTPDVETDKLLLNVIRPLYDVYLLLSKARRARGTMDLDMPERKILLDDTGAMAGLAVRERFDSHRLIEEFMVLANVAAALALLTKKAPCVYRVHDAPSLEKVQNLKTYLTSFGIEVPHDAIDEPAQMASILTKAKDKPYRLLVQEMMLRSQMQAHYATDNIGHFGLALNHYAHFTSPIRRYADLLVHRSLIRAYNLGEGGLRDEDKIRLDSMCDHISVTERASMEAERNTVDRFSAAFMVDKVGSTFTATISSVTRFGLFVRLAETGADGLVPIRLLENDYFIHDEQLHALIGRRTGLVYRLGAQMRVELIEAAPLAGALMFKPVDENGADIEGYELKVTPDMQRGGVPSRGKPRGPYKGNDRGGGRGRDSRGGPRKEGYGAGGNRGGKPSSRPFGGGKGKKPTGRGR